MGYYDEGNQNRYPQRKGNKGRYFLASLAAAVLGGLIVIFATPVLSDYGLLPYKVEPQNNAGEQGSQRQEPGETTNISLNVSSGITEAVDKAGEAVVGITNIQDGGGFWSRNNDGQASGSGSGVVYKKEGDTAYVVTNYHVVEGASKVEVSLSDGSKVEADLSGVDPWTDLAVLKIPAGNVKKVAEFGGSDQLKIGEPAIAIGNPLGPMFSGSVTQGIISGLERTIPVDINQDGTPDWQAEVLQTDAAINPGNSGGALVNIQGQLIGINSMKIAQSAVEGIGLAIPINYARPVIEDLEEHGEVRRPYMGVAMASVNEIPEHYQQQVLQLPKEVDYGVAIQQVVPGSPADLAGLQEMDVIVEMDGKKVNDIIELRRYLYNEKEVGEELTVTYYREGERDEAKLTLTQEDLDR